jgi:hypothetical protein
MRGARVDQVAEGAFDAIERNESLCPLLKQGHQVGRNGLPECEPFLQLRWIEDGLDVFSVDVIAAIALN